MSLLAEGCGERRLAGRLERTRMLSYGYLKVNVRFLFLKGYCETQNKARKVIFP